MTLYDNRWPYSCQGVIILTGLSKNGLSLPSGRCREFDAEIASRASEALPAEIQRLR